MMTHVEIEAAIERLRELGCDGRITTSNIIDAVFDGNNYKVRDTLIELLEQADPDTHVELPKDADGVPIHFGDELTNPHHAESFTVDAIGGNSGVGSVPHVVYFRSSGGNLRFHYATQCHHYHKPPTIEGLLTEFSEYVLRSGHQWGLNAPKAIAAFAEKLREVMADDDAR